MSAWNLLQSLDFVDIVLLFWYTTLLEFPRYVLGAIILPTIALWWRRPYQLDTRLALDIVLVGLNEEAAVRKCLNSLAEQTILELLPHVRIIVVDDGSTDRMSEIAMEMRREGKADTVLRLVQRGGKSAGVNLALSECHGDIVIIADIDTTFDRDAMAIMLSYFSDPTVGAVGGNLGVRNASATLMTRCQAIEYAIGLSLGRCIADTFGTLTIISGAFGAFRREALEAIGRQDVEVGEDADLSMKLRRAGWHLRFAPEAYALTDVPENVPSFVAQRLRWDRGIITIWSRKFRSVLNPWQSTFRINDVFALLDVILYQVVLAFAFPFYLIWLIYSLGAFLGPILGATLIGYAALNLAVFIATVVSGFRISLSLIVYLPAYTMLQFLIVRPVRLIAIVQELIFRSSYRDPYVPRHVMDQVDII